MALRFDLVGDARVLAPMVVHLADRTLRWTDLNLSAMGYGHNVRRYGPALGHAAEDMELAHGTGRRPTFLDVVAAHAAGRAERVWIRFTDGTAREVAPSYAAILDTAAHGVGDGPLPGFDDAPIFFAAADRLLESVATAGLGSILVAATSGDPPRTSTPPTY